MNAIQLLTELNVLRDVRWKSTKGYIARIDRKSGKCLHVSIEIAFHGTWIPDKVWSVDDFLASHKPIRSLKR